MEQWRSLMAACYIRRVEDLELCTKFDSTDLENEIWKGTHTTHLSRIGRNCRPIFRLCTLKVTKLSMHVCRNTSIKMPVDSNSSQPAIKSNLFSTNLTNRRHSMTESLLSISSTYWRLIRCTSNTREPSTNRDNYWRLIRCNLQPTETITDDFMSTFSTYRHTCMIMQQTSEAEHGQRSVNNEQIIHWNVATTQCLCWCEQVSPCPWKPWWSHWHCERQQHCSHLCLCAQRWLTFSITNIPCLLLLWQYKGRMTRSNNLQKFNA